MTDCKHYEVLQLLESTPGWEEIDGNYGTQGDFIYHLDGIGCFKLYYAFEFVNCKLAVEDFELSFQPDDTTKYEAEKWGMEFYIQPEILIDFVENYKPKKIIYQNYTVSFNIKVPGALDEKNYKYKIGSSQAKITNLSIEEK